MNRKLALALAAPAAAVAAGGAALIGPAAQARPAAHVTPHVAAAGSSKLHFLLVSVNDAMHAVLHGGVNDYGKDTSPNDSYDVFHGKHGSFRVNHPQSSSTFTPKVDNKTCYVSFTETGKFTINHGTGSYAGIKAHGSFSGHGAGYTPRKSDGSCNLNAQPKLVLFYLNGTGTRTS